MAARRRHWKEKDGRFWARISIPVILRSLFDGKTELSEALGGDLRAADRGHAAAVARLLMRIQQASRQHAGESTEFISDPVIRLIMAADQDQAVWSHYHNTLLNDDQMRAAMPTQTDIDAEHEQILKLIDLGELDVGRDPALLHKSRQGFIS